MLVVRAQPELSNAADGSENHYNHPRKWLDDIY
jgi:hypothetical protein